MCTAASYKTKNTYFGRTLDYEFSYGEKVVLTPRKYPFHFRFLGENKNHYAILGMAHVNQDYPLYYDAMNECGLAMSGLNFVGNAFYQEEKENEKNVGQYEFLPFILSNCRNVDEAEKLIREINLTKTPYSPQYPTSSLHYILRDPSRCIVVESMKDGIHIYENKTGCLTNNPPFPHQMENLKNYVSLSNEQNEKTFSFDDSFYSRGMGGIGLPGDLSSQSRFVRVCFTSHFSCSKEDEASSVNQFFHILESVWQTRGLCKMKDQYEITIYASCMNLEKGIYYWKTYERSQPYSVSMHKENLDSSSLILFEEEPLPFAHPLN